MRNEWSEKKEVKNLKGGEQVGNKKAYKLVVEKRGDRG